LNDGTKIRVETRACDYALAVCVKFSGQSFQDYGFDILGSRSDMFDSWLNAGFTNDETRKAAIKKYEEWRKANPI
jgi:heme/copper-type cytochrome/quinol oxidase subunit 2